MAVLTILYFDQRVRKEGFDLQLTVQGLGVEPDPSHSAPAPFVEPERFTRPSSAPRRRTGRPRRAGSRHRQGMPRR